MIPTDRQRIDYLQRENAKLRRSNARLQLQAFGAIVAGSAAIVVAFLVVYWN
jgi:hypothetical protein